MTISIKPNQTFLDAVLMQCGTVEAAMQLAHANDRAITDDIVVDETLHLPGTITEDIVAKNYLQQSGITIGTKG